MSQTGTCARKECGKPWQASDHVRNKKFCSRECGYAILVARQREKAQQERGQRRIVQEQERQAALKWKPGPWEPPESWQAGHPPPRPDRRMPSAHQIAEYWKQRGEPFAVDMAAPACFGCGIETEGWGGLERAHIVARVCDGLDGEQNLTLLCWRCHRFQPDGESGGQRALWYIMAGGWVGMAFRYAISREQVAEFRRRALREI